MSQNGLSQADKRINIYDGIVLFIINANQIIQQKKM
jgi:hypothetical protein